MKVSVRRQPLRKGFRDDPGFQGAQADPGNAVDSGNGFDQLRQAVPSVQVYAIISQVLRHHKDFFHPAGSQGTAFVEEAVKVPRLVASCHNRYGTIGTGAVASFRNFQIGIVSRSSQDAPVGYVFVETAAQGFHDSLPVELAEKAVHFGDFLCQILAITLGKAADDVQLPNPPRLFALHLFEDGIHRFLLGIADEAASIDNHHVGIRLVHVRLRHIARLLQLLQQHLGIHQVLGTSQTDYICFFHVSEG